jgi:hypothetical protein
VEYVLGTDPLTATADGPDGALAGDDFTFTFQRDHASMTADISLVIEVGTDLGVWGDVYQVGVDTGSSSAGVTVVDNGTSDTVTLTITRAPEDRRFARLRVTVTP